MTELEELRLAYAECSRQRFELLAKLKNLLQETEPVAWRTFDGEGGYDYRTYDMNEDYQKEWVERNPNHADWVEPLYTSPPKREWQGLTDEEINEVLGGDIRDEPSGELKFVRAIEAKLKDKNNG